MIKWSRKTIGISTKILLFLAPPMVIVLLLYPLRGELIFDGKKYQQSEFKIENLFNQKPPTFRNLAARVFSAPLYLDWYKVLVINNSVDTNPHCLIKEPTTVYFTFLKGNPDTYYSTLTKTNDGVAGELNYSMKGGESAYFIAQARQEFSINGGLIFSGDCAVLLHTPTYEGGDLIFDYQIFLKPYWKAWMVQLTVIYIFWIFLLTSLISLWHWLGGMREKNHAG